MPYNVMFFGHAPCGFAVKIGTTQIGYWEITERSAARMANLSSFLATADDQEIRDRYYETQVDDYQGESFLILTENTFRKVWTTPSGLLFNWRDYIDPRATFDGQSYNHERARIQAMDAEGARRTHTSDDPDLDLRGIFRFQMIDLPFSQIPSPATRVTAPWIPEVEDVDG